jgi:acyl-coenzyme A thioesterase PaaI-like protein
VTESTPAAGIDERTRRVVQRFMDAIPHQRDLGISYHAHGADWAELELAYAPDLVAYPDSGVIASAAIYSLMDSTAGFSVMVALKETAPIATLDLRLDYLHAATPHQPVIGRATCYKLTRRIAFVRGVAHQGDPANPVANMVATFMLLGGQ